jgi:hypothetical protein
MEVKTDSEEVNRHRKMIIELQLARCPNNDFVKKLGEQYGVEAPRFQLEELHPLWSLCPDVREDRCQGN